MGGLAFCSRSRHCVGLQAASNPPAKSKSSGGFFTNMFSYQAGTAKAPSPRVSRARTLSDAPAPSIWKTVEGTLKGAAEVSSSDTWSLSTRRSIN